MISFISPEVIVVKEPIVHIEPYVTALSVYIPIETPKMPSSEDFYPQVLAMITEAGFDAEIADKVIECESNRNPLAVGDHGESLGLWQIHQPAHNTGSKAFDPYWATEYAISLLESSRSWSHWSCFNKLY